MSVASILGHTPIWVFVLLAGLVVLGLLQARTRRVSTRVLSVTSLALAAASAYSVHATFPSVPSALFAWALGVAVACVLGPRLLRLPALDPAGIDPAGGTFELRGSWWPLVLMMAMFGVKFWAGMSLAIDPGRATHPLFAVTLGAAYGVLGGLFLARLAGTLKSLRGSRLLHSPA